MRLQKFKNPQNDLAEYRQDLFFNFASDTESRKPVFSLSFFYENQESNQLSCIVTSKRATLKSALRAKKAQQQAQHTLSPPSFDFTEIKNSSPFISSSSSSVSASASSFALPPSSSTLPAPNTSSLLSYPPSNSRSSFFDALNELQSISDSMFSLVRSMPSSPSVFPHTADLQALILKQRPLLQQLYSSAHGFHAAAQAPSDLNREEKSAMDVEFTQAWSFSGSSAPQSHMPLSSSSSSCSSSPSSHSTAIVAASHSTSSYLSLSDSLHSHRPAPPMSAVDFHPAPPVLASSDSGLSETPYTAMSFSEAFLHKLDSSVVSFIPSVDPASPSSTNRSPHCTQENIDKVIQLYNLPQINRNLVSSLHLVGRAHYGDLLVMYIDSEKKAVKLYDSGVSAQMVQFHEAFAALLQEQAECTRLNAHELQILQLIRRAVVPEAWLRRRGKKGLVYRWIVNEQRPLTPVDWEALRAQLDVCHKLGFALLDVSPRNILLTCNAPAVFLDYECVCQIGKIFLGPLPPESSQNVRRRDAVIEGDDEFLWQQLSSSNIAVVPSTTMTTAFLRPSNGALLPTTATISTSSPSTMALSCQSLSFSRFLDFGSSFPALSSENAWGSSNASLFDDVSGLDTGAAAGNLNFSMLP